MLHTEIKAKSADELLGLMKAALAELTKRYSADCSMQCDEAMSQTEAAIADLECEIGLAAESRRENRDGRFVGTFARWVA